MSGHSRHSSGACHSTSPALDEHLEPTLGPVLGMAAHVPEVIPFPNVERGRHSSSLSASVPDLPLLCEHYGSFRSDSTPPCSPVDLREKPAGCCTGGTNRYEYFTVALHLEFLVHLKLLVHLKFLVHLFLFSISNSCPYGWQRMRLLRVDPV